MNYLAHAYLSFNHDGILAGNMISDFVKGNKRFGYEETIQKGITLHRLIDRFTDDHDATRQAKEIFRPAYRLYCGAFVDVVYDHFLAADEKIFEEKELAGFAAGVYQKLETHFAVFPVKFQQLFPFMKSQNWLYHYRYRWGTEKSFEGLVRRSAYLRDSSMAAVLFHENYQELQTCYRAFMPAVYAFSKGEFDKLANP